MLAHLVRAYLRHEGTPNHASFETDWVPQDYLDDYYWKVEPDERSTIAFFVDAMREIKGGEPVLLFGVGPTLHHVFLAAEKASEIHLGEYLPANLHEIERWLARDPGAHDWTPFVRYTLQCEGVRQPTSAQVAEREERTRAKISRLLEVDLRQADPLLGATVPAYGTVISAYCADSATADRAAWALYTRRIAALVRPGGTLLLAALRRSRAYHVGGKSFPSADIDETSVHAVLRTCGFASVGVAACALEDVAAKGYSSIVLARAGPVLEAPVASLRRPPPAIPGCARTTADRTALPGP
ncbi:MAG: guanitoxin biosynthesis pre-guanitoxin forming N-methyltransferase GntF [Geminicoccaceae bacterium]